MATNGSKKKRPPKHLEKMLFINYKEDQMLHDKLEEIHVESRSREIELDHERLNVKKEWRASRRKKIPIESLNQGSPTQSPVLGRKFDSDDDIEKPLFLSTPSQSRPMSSKDSSDNVNAYLLGEYRRMSEVIPSILLTLSKKDEKRAGSATSRQSRQQTNVQLAESPHLEPDLYRITKLARAVKTMRQNLAFSRKIDMNRPRMSLSKMFKDIHDSRNEIDQYTDGTCVLLKRKIEKRRRESLSDMEDTSTPMPQANRLSKVQSAPQIHGGWSNQTTQKRHSIATTGMTTNNDIGSYSKRSSFSGASFKRQASLPGSALHSIAQEEESEDEQVSSIKIDDTITEARTVTAAKSAVLKKTDKLLPKRRSVSTTIRPNFSRDSSPPAVRTISGRSRGLSRSATNLSSSADDKFIDEDEFRARQRVAREWEKYEKLKRKVDRFLVLDSKSSQQPLLV